MKWIDFKYAIKAFWWGFTHVFATKEMHKANAKKLAKEYMEELG